MGENRSSWRDERTEVDEWAERCRESQRYRWSRPEMREPQPENNDAE